MTIESATRFLRDHMLYMDLVVLFFGMLAYKAFDKRTLLLFINVIVGIVVVLVSHYTITFGNNLYVSYIYAPYEAIMFSAILYPISQHKKARLAVKLIIGAILITNLLEGLLIEDGFSKYNSYTYVLINLLIGSLAIRHLLQLRFDSEVDNLAKTPMFWVATSLALKNFGVLIVWAFLRTAQQDSMELLWQLTFIREAVIYITLILWITAFWVARKGYYKA